MTVLLLGFVLAAPMAMLACVLIRGAWASRIAIAGSAATLGLALLIAWRVLAQGPAVVAGGWLHADALAALLACVIGAVGVSVTWYAQSYMPFIAQPHTARWHAGRFHALLMLLLGALALAAVSNNLGLMWIAIEASTLASALLVGYDRRPGAVEAGWKYLVLCSVGVALALFATVLLYYSAVSLFGEGGAGLQWAALKEVAGGLEPRFVRLAFLFALVGYGTKAGLAPMHTWLPDAYSQAPTPASALMSGGVLATSLVALLRFHAIAIRCVGPEYSSRLLIVFGLLSLAVAVPFMLIQGDYKRLLAYSSLEHAGLVVLGVGFGGPLAVMGALFHLVNQSLAKTLAFLVGGTLAARFGSQRFDRWAGALTAARGAGVLFVLAGVALASLPPSALFLSQWLTLLGGLHAGHGAAVIAALVALALVGVALAFHWTRVALGTPHASESDPPRAAPPAGLAPQWALVAVLALLGVWIPSPVRHLLEQAAAVLQP